MSSILGGPPSGTRVTLRNRRVTSQGRVKATGSVRTSFTSMWVGSILRQRSCTLSLSLCGASLRSNGLSPRMLIASTTRVSPSQWPIEWAFHIGHRSSALGCGRPSV